MYFYGLDLRPLAQGRLDYWDPCLKKLGKGPPGYATYKFQVSEPSGSEEKIFKYFSVYLYGSNLGPPPDPVPF